MAYNNPDDYLKKIIKDEIRKNKGSSSFFSHLFAGILGAIISAFLIIHSLNIKSVKSIDQKVEEKPKANESTINIKNDNAVNFEKAVVKKSMDTVVGITTVAPYEKKTIFGTQSGYIEGVGSGVLVTKDGYILTNSHVIENGKALEIEVVFSNQKMTKAKLVWNDQALDLAVIKIEGNYNPVEIGDSDRVEIGDRVVAIGNPLTLKLQSSVTSGIISGLNRSVTFNTGVTMDGLMQTDAAINSGNSGGALLNEKGQLIGINTAKAGNSDGIGFAIPINTAKSIVNRIKETGNFKPVYLGISGVQLEKVKPYFEKKHIKLKTDYGVFVDEVFDKSSNLQSGDIIVSIDSKPVKDMAQMKKILLNYKLKDRAVIKILRNNEFIDIDFIFTKDSSNIDEFTRAKPDEHLDDELFDSLIP